MLIYIFSNRLCSLNKYIYGLGLLQINKQVCFLALDGSQFFQFSSCVGFSHSILVSWATQEIFLSLPEIKLMAFPLGSPNVFPLRISEHTFVSVGIPCYSALDCPDSVTHFEDHQCLRPNSFNIVHYLLD